MAIKNMLKLEHLTDFKIFAENNGFYEVPIMGEFELLRMVKPKTKPIIIYSCNNVGYVSFAIDLISMVKEFFKENGDK